MSRTLTNNTDSDLTINYYGNIYQLNKNTAEQVDEHLYNRFTQIFPQTSETYEDEIYAEAGIPMDEEPEMVEAYDVVIVEVAPQEEVSKAKRAQKEIQDATPEPEVFEEKVEEPKEEMSLKDIVARVSRRGRRR